MPRRRSKREPVTLDEEGHTLKGMGAGAESTTPDIGASMWEFFHPGQVQSEYEAAGKTVPSAVDIMGEALDTAAQKAAENVQTIESAAGVAVQAVPSMIKWIAAAIVAYVILQAVKVCKFLLPRQAELYLPRH